LPAKILLLSANRTRALRLARGDKAGEGATGGELHKLRGPSSVASFAGTVACPTLAPAAALGAPKDARMSGTSYGACVLHVAPESFIGGPLALVRDSDVIELDIPAQRLSLNVSDEELARRRAQWRKPSPRYARGYGCLFSDHVAQANEGCDFDFLDRGPSTPDPEIH
jgi:hypothetical protein